MLALSIGRVAGRIAFANADLCIIVQPGSVFQLHERLVPAALLSRSNPSDPNQMEAIMTPQLTGRQRDTMKSLQRKALVSWWETGHPGWRIWERDTETFMRSVHTPSVSSPCGSVACQVSTVILIQGWVTIQALLISFTVRSQNALHAAASCSHNLAAWALPGAAVCQGLAARLAVYAI